jgi:hypothetical protein
MERVRTKMERVEHRFHSDKPVCPSDQALLIKRWYAVVCRSWSSGTIVRLCFNSFSVICRPQQAATRNAIRGQALLLHNILHLWKKLQICTSGVFEGKGYTAGDGCFWLIPFGISVLWLVIRNGSEQTNRPIDPLPTNRSQPKGCFLAKNSKMYTVI